MTVEKVTDWMPFNAYGIQSYRIYKKTDGVAWWQSHEYLRDDWITERTKWIASEHGFFS